MRFNQDEIKSAILDEWGTLSIDPWPEDRLLEIAEGFVPIYYGEIVKDWTEMPVEYTDNWKEQYGGIIPKDLGITALMTSDLYEYYRDTTTEIYHQILKDKEDN